LLVEVLSVPAVNVNVFAVKLLPSVHSPPTPLNTIGAFVRATVLVVIVFPVVVALKVIVPLELQTVPANSDIEPRTFRVGDVPVANVTVPAETVMSRHAKAPVIVTV
jgi:hypothetical protein